MRRSDGRGMAYSQPIAPGSERTRSRRCGQAANGQRHSLGSAHRRALARYARTVWQLELGLHALLALEQARGLGCGVRNAGFSRAPGRRGTCHRLHDRAGAPTCSRRKRGNQKQEALGRSRGDFSNKIHLRTNAHGEPLGEAHEVKGYEALIELHDVAPDRLLGDKGYDSDAIRDDLTKRGIDPVIPPHQTAKRRSNTITKPTSGATSLSDVSTVSNSFAVLQRVTKKLPEPTFQCYPSQPQGSG